MADGITNKDIPLVENALLFQYAKRADKALKNRTPDQKKKAILAAEKEIKELPPEEKLEALQELKNKSNQT